MDLHLDSKTVLGLISILILATILVFFNKLTPEMVDVIKWIGGAYMAVRGIANYTGK